MTGSERRGGTPVGPPWPVDVLADLHAGAFDENTSAVLWPQVRRDPDAVSVLAALDATSADLGALARPPITPIPPSVAARLDAAMAAEADVLFANAPVVSLDAARRRRTKRISWAAGIVATAAAVLGIAVITLPHNANTTPGVAGAPPAAAFSTPLALTHAQLTAAVLGTALGRDDYGPLADPVRRAACLAANGQDPNRVPAGAMRITLDGRPGVLMVLTTDQYARYRLLVVGADCAAGHPATLADTVIGGISGLPTQPTR
jgi:hypothetical protein